MKRQYAYACGINVLCKEITLSYHGVLSDRDWLSAKNLLPLGKFFRFRIPGKFQPTIAGTDWLPRIPFLPKSGIYHSFSYYPISMDSIQGVGTLVDFIPLRIPEYSSPGLSKALSGWCDWAQKHPGRKWIAISERTRQDAITLGKVKESQICVVNLAVDDDMFMAPDGEAIRTTLDTFGLAKFPNRHAWRSR